MGVAISPSLLKTTSNNATKNSFKYGDTRIAYTREPRDPQATRIKIKVFPDCKVHVLAPLGASDAEVLNAVKRRSRWIYEKLRDFKAQLTDITPRQYVSGESHYYLGRQYTLRVNAVPRSKPIVKLTRGVLEITVGKKDPQRVKQTLNDWYKQSAKQIFHKQLDSLLAQALWFDTKPNIRILSMKTQWGSCSPKGLITLNPHLVKAPKDCIDYVILHELCHLVEHNHSQRFYRLLKQVMPNWEKVKSRLDSRAHQLLNV